MRASARSPDGQEVRDIWESGAIQTKKLGRTHQPGGMTMKMHFEGLPAAANVEQSIIQAQLQIVKDLERRKQSAAAVQLLIDSVTRLAA